MVKLDYDSSQTHNLSEITTNDDGCLQTEASVPIKDADFERKHAFISLAECLSIERALESSIPERKPVTPAACASVDSTLSGENSVDHFLVTESKVVNTDSYMDKAITEIERPKMIVCFEKEAYELVKDICVDNVVQSFDKVSSPKDKVDDQKIDTVYSQGEWTNVNVVPGFDNLSTFLMNEQSISNVHNGVSKEQLHGTENYEEDKIVIEHASLLSDGKTKDRCGDEVCFSTVESAADEFPRLVDEKAHTLQCSEDVNREDSFKRDSSKEENTRESSVFSDDEPGTSDNLGVGDKSRDVPLSEVDSENIKQHGNDAPDTENETEGTLVSPQHGHLRDANKETSDGLTAEARSSLVHYGFADDSLFGQHSVPNSISFSGQVAYNGSTSLRSDSSTTSTRSFAFPILQSEWNSSPVKMAKPDRKYYRRHRWRNSILCCRF